MKFKTIVGRVSYADEFDDMMEKEMKKLTDMGKKIIDVHIATSDRTIVAIIKYEEKKSGSRKAAAAQA